MTLLLLQADLGLAIGTGIDVAIEASDLTLISGDLNGAADAIRLSRRTLATIKGSLFKALTWSKRSRGDARSSGFPLGLEQRIVRSSDGGSD